MTIDVLIHRRPQLTTLYVRGRVTGTSSPQFEREVLEALDRTNGGLVIDCAGLAYINSNGLRALILVLKRAHAKGISLTLVCPEGFVREVLTITGLARLFRIDRPYPSAVLGEGAAA